MGGERMAKGVTTCSFSNSGRCYSPFDSSLHNVFIHVMPAFFGGFRVLPSVLLREDPLPAPIGGRVGILAIQSVGHLHPSPPFGKVFLMDRLDLSQMVLKRFLKQFREHRYPVFRYFAVADTDFIARKVNVLNAQLKTLHHT